jgi:hypothetical protein
VRFTPGASGAAAPKKMCEGAAMFLDCCSDLQIKTCPKNVKAGKCIPALAIGTAPRGRCRYGMTAACDVHQLILVQIALKMKHS